MHDYYLKDSRRAVDAKFKAQEIAFAPLSFQAARALRETGILERVATSGESGCTAEVIAKDLGLSVYGVGVLLEMGLGMELVKLSGAAEELSYVLVKLGFLSWKTR